MNELRFHVLKEKKEAGRGKEERIKVLLPSVDEFPAGQLSVHRPGANEPHT